MNTSGRHFWQVPLLALSLGSAMLIVNAQQVKKVGSRFTSPWSGQQMYSEYCAACHGKDGKGDGPAAPALNKPASDLTRLSARYDGKYPYAQVQSALRNDLSVAAHGSKDMPVWGPVFSEMAQGNAHEVQLRITKLTKYIEELQEK